MNSLSFGKKYQEIVKKTGSILCVGLDPVLENIPSHLQYAQDPIFEFNQAIIEATQEFVSAYKPNMAYYEQYGPRGLECLQKTIDIIPKDIPVILDAKRGDIAASSLAYVKAIFDYYSADAVTVNPYMGYDALQPFFDCEDKGIFVLCLTSNPGAEDFQKEGDREPLYLSVAKQVVEWNRFKNLGLVVGATQVSSLQGVRRVAPDLPILLPGVGTQGGDLSEAVRHGMGTTPASLIINVSRAILYAGSGRDFATQAKEAAQHFRDQIASYLSVSLA